MALACCVDLGSTFTKGVLVSLDSGEVLAAASHLTTSDSDVMDGVDAVCRSLTSRGHVAFHDEPETLLCSSAGGGLRIAVVGYERAVTGEAGHKVALSAGGRVVHVAAGPLDQAAMGSLRAAEPDLILLVGGTDGGNAEVLRHNASRLAKARMSTPIVLAGNAEAAGEIADLLAEAGRRHTVAANVLPRIGVIAPAAARDSIRTVFLEHVIGGKGLSRDRGFAELVRSATPDAVRRGVDVLATVRGHDLVVVDIGGATTDVYSAITPQGEDATIERDVAGTLWRERTVEADLGMRWNALGIVEAAEREHLPLSPHAVTYAAHVASATAHQATTAAEWSAEGELAQAAAVVALRRHARPRVGGERARPLADVGLIVGSGGVLRHGPPELADAVLDAVCTDHAGGWSVPREAATVTDTAYLLCAVGLLAAEHPGAAEALAAQVGQRLVT